jgi:hypothetical protein
MRLGELKLALAAMTDDEAEIQVGVMGLLGCSEKTITCGPGSIELLYRAHPDEPGRGQLLIYSAPTSWPPAVE